MAKLKSILGYIVAALSIPVMMAAVLSFAILGLGGPFVEATGLQTSANWTGGEVVQMLEHGTYRTEVHRPVFDALIGERREGFVQVAWRPADALPARIDEEIDADADGRADFRVELETATRQATLTPYSADVLELEGVYRLDETLAIRVKLKNTR
jgi:hypothetical protein